MIPYSDRLRVALLPLDIKWAEKETNLAAVARAFEHLPESTDIVVLPELFSTGYADDIDAMQALAERNTQSTIDFIKNLANKYTVAIAGSFLASTPPKIYNRGFFIEPSGEETYYDKRHLFSVSAESHILAPGDRRMPSVRFRGWNISMIVCYDLRFPVWCRARRNEYDLLLVPANWPQARGYAFEHLLIARAIENQCYVAGANRGGQDTYGLYDGLTQIYDYRGMPIGNSDGNSPFVTADLSRHNIDDFRTKFPVADDADDFNLLQ
ncbi:MAG: nitrilase family protein [Muribaculaceae bacterium]|nr:nitrilase family protein [Muribaculaceae bacterium]